MPHAPPSAGTAPARWRRALPSLLSGARLASAAPLAWALAGAHVGPALALLAFAAASDVADGRLARRWCVAGARGAWLDASADLAVVLAGFGALAGRGLLPAWLPLVVAAMFGWFVLSSRRAGRGRPVYDPVGKAYGALLLGALALAALLPDPALLAALSGAVVGLTLVSLASRIVALHGPAAERSTP